MRRQPCATYVRVNESTGVVHEGIGTPLAGRLTTMLGRSPDRVIECEGSRVEGGRREERSFRPLTTGLMSSAGCLGTPSTMG